MPWNNKVFCDVFLFLDTCAISYLERSSKIMKILKVDSIWLLNLLDVLQIVILSALHNVESRTTVCLSGRGLNVNP